MLFPLQATWSYFPIPMTEDHKKKLQSKLWNIADTLRGKMGADEFRDYILTRKIDF